MTTPTLTDNWFAAGLAILEQLQTECGTAFTRIASAPSLDTLGRTLTGVTPAVYVVPGPLSGGVPPQQTWYVVVHAHQVEQIAAGVGLLAEAGALISVVLAALAHFVPGPEFGALRMPAEDHRHPDPGQGLYILTYAVALEPEFWPYY